MARPLYYCVLEVVFAWHCRATLIMNQSIRKQCNGTPKDRMAAAAYAPILVAALAPRRIRARVGGMRFARQGETLRPTPTSIVSALVVESLSMFPRSHPSEGWRNHRFDIFFSCAAGISGSGCCGEVASRPGCIHQVRDLQRQHHGWAIGHKPRLLPPLARLLAHPEFFVALARKFAAVTVAVTRLTG